MIKHHILWRYTEDGLAYGKEALAAELNRRFKGLVGRLEGLRSIEVRTTEIKADPGFHDVLLYAEFDDKAALERYMLDEGHGAIRDWDQQYVCDRAGFDYEV